MVSEPRAPSSFLFIMLVASKPPLQTPVSRLSSDTSRSSDLTSGATPSPTLSSRPHPRARLGTWVHVHNTSLTTGPLAPMRRSVAVRSVALRHCAASAKGGWGADASACSSVLGPDGAEPKRMRCRTRALPTLRGCGTVSHGGGGSDIRPRSGAETEGLGQDLPAANCSSPRRRSAQAVTAPPLRRRCLPPYACR